MKIFISWSGDRSKAIAAAFKEWLPAVVQAARPYFSPSDIDKGSRWSSEISKELESASVGLICLTKENLNAPWLMFEAGALSKSLDKSRVCPMLFGIEPSDLSGPLVQFQATAFSKEEVLKLIRTVNQQLEQQALDVKVLDSVFEKWWPDLDTKIQKILENSPAARDANLRSDREILEEVLQLTRTYSNKIRSVQKHEQDSRDSHISSFHATELIAVLNDYGTYLLSSATEAKQLNEFLPLAAETTNFALAGMGEVIHKRMANKSRLLISQIQDRAAELDDEIPF